MSYHTIDFGKETTFNSRGGNRYVNTTGLQVSLAGEDVFFEPINSRGTLTEAIRVSVAFDSIDAVIQALTDLKATAALNPLRNDAAQHALDAQDFPAKAIGFNGWGWDASQTEWNTLVDFKDSTRGTFTVRFKPDSAEVAETSLS